MIFFAVIFWPAACRNGGRGGGYPHYGTKPRLGFLNPSLIMVMVIICLMMTIMLMLIMVIAGCGDCGGGANVERWSGCGFLALHKMWVSEI